MDRGAWHAQSMGSQRVGHDLATKQPQQQPWLCTMLTLGEEGCTGTLYPIYSFPISLKLFQNKVFFFLKYIGSYCSSAEKPPVSLNVRCTLPYHGLQIATGSDPAHLSSHFLHLGCPCPHCLKWPLIPKLSLLFSCSETPCMTIQPKTVTCHSLLRPPPPLPSYLAFYFLCVEFEFCIF